MGAFDFLAATPTYRESPCAILRLERRHGFLVAPFRDEIADRRVLDLGAHDGRWSYALAAAGAAEVVAVEARQDLTERLALLPDDAAARRITLQVDDVFTALERAVARGETFDFVAVFGLFYHVMDHFRFLSLIRQLQPQVVVIDGDFTKRPLPVITLQFEDPDNPLNAPRQMPGQPRAVKGVSSASALEMMAEALGYAVEWSDWDSLPPDQRSGVQDYYASESRRLWRRTAVLRPKG